VPFWPKIPWKRPKSDKPFTRTWLFSLGLGLLIGVAALYDQGRVTTDVASSACRVQVTAERLPLRAEPEPGPNISVYLERGDIRPASTTVRNGYRQLTTGEWASDQYLKPLPPADRCTPS
jgi:hypothetical protein